MAESLQAGRLADQPEQEAVLRSTLARTYGELGEHESAIEQAQLALDLQCATGGAFSMAAAAAHNVIAVALLETGRRAEAKRHAETALEVCRMAQGDCAPQTAGLLSTLARVTGNRPESVAILDQALAISQGQFGAGHVEVARILSERGTMLTSLGSFGPAAEDLRAALEIHLRSGGPDELALAGLRKSLAYIYSEQGRLDEAQGQIDEAMRIVRGHLDARHPVFSSTVNMLGMVCFRRNDLAGAAAAFEEALAAARAVYGPDHAAVAATLGNLGRVQQRQGHWDAAEASQREALAIARRTSGTDQSQVATRLVNLGKFLSKVRGDHDAATRLLADAVAIRRRQFGTRNPRLAAALVSQGWALQRANRPSEAEPAFREAISILEREKQAGLMWAEAQAGLGLVLVELEQQEEAARLLSAARPGLSATEGIEPAITPREVDQILERLRETQRGTAPARASATEPEAPASGPARGAAPPFASAAKGL
jgi:tetratricopeptide (TPR) repeat protein